MKKFLIKILAMLLCLAILMGAYTGVVFRIVRPYSENRYPSSVLDKLERLKSIDEPKIILVGNSNLSFGCDSAMLESAMDMPVVNLGLQGAFGNVFHENLAKTNIGNGDIVVLVHTEYDNDSMYSPELMCDLLSVDLRLMRYADPRDYVSILRALPTYLREHAKSNIMPTGIYSRSAFNAYGDIGNSKTENKYEFVEDSVVLPKLSDEGVRRLNRLNRYCEKRGASLVIASYPIAQCEYTPPADDYIRFQEELETRLDCDIISDFTDYLMPTEYFYDTNLHLTDDGMRVRTELLIADLQRWQASQS